MDSFQSLERLLQVGIAALMLVAGGALTFALLWLRRNGVIGGGGAKAKPLAKHKVAAELLQSGWAESNYNNMIESVHKEIHMALRNRDQETLGVYCQGKALQTFLAKIQDPPLMDDRREILQGSVRISWDPQSERLVTVLAISRWVKNWRRFYEKWTLQRQGKAWFLVDREPGQEPK
jgi:hypothetical protein